MYDAFIVEAQGYATKKGCVRGYAQIDVETAREIIGALESSIWTIESGELQRIVEENDDPTDEQQS